MSRFTVQGGAGSSGGGTGPAVGGNEGLLIKDSPGVFTARFNQSETTSQTDTSTSTIRDRDDESLNAHTETASLRLSGSENQPALVHAQTMEVVYIATGTWVAPAGVTSATIEAWGGGRGGSSATTTGGAGGAGGDYVRSIVPVTPGTSYTVTVGAGGGSSLLAGGDSWFNTATTVRAKGGGSANTSIGTIIRTGGAGGPAGTLTGAGNGGGGGGGTNTNGTAATAHAGGAGGTLFGGNGGNGGAANAVGTAGAIRGGGGGGAGGGLTGTRAGGAGARGEVMILWNTGN